MNQGIKLPHSISNFEDLVTQDYYYVDKTHYIELLENTDKKYLFYLRPRRFGKSLFISILQHYYGLEYKDKFQQLFGNYYIGQHPTSTANQYMVIDFEFTKITVKTTENTEKGFLERVKAGVERFFNTYSSFFSVTEIKETLRKNVASDVMEKVVTLMLKNAPDKKLYVLIDEYDHFANELIAFQLEEFKKVVSEDGYVRKFYEAIKEGTKQGVVDRFFATGITPITLDSMTSGFNIATDLSLDLNMAEMMGFKEEVVKELFELSNPSRKEDTDKVLPLMKEWYNGYLFNEDAPNKLYNPNMVLYYLSAYQTYGKSPDEMLDTNISSDYSKVRRLLTVETPDENYESLKEIVREKKVRGSITAQFTFARKFTQDDFLSLLFYQGFLTIESKWAKEVTFRVPNYVVQELYIKYFWELLEERDGIKMKVGKIRDAVREMALKGNPHPFFQLVHEVLHQLANRDYQNFDEKYVKLIIMAQMMMTDAYYIESERETPAGYLDVSLLQRPNVPINHQYIFELKYLKKENAKRCNAEQKAAKKQLLDYIADSEKLQDLSNLQAWTVVVIKDELKVERVN
ncbi:MAG: AAA family ATPase [Chitinophagales bacterium]